MCQAGVCRGLGSGLGTNRGKVGPHQCPRRWTICDNTAPLRVSLIKSIPNPLPGPTGIQPRPQPLLNQTPEKAHSYTVSTLLPGGRVSSQVPHGWKAPSFHDCSACHLRRP